MCWCGGGQEHRRMLLQLTNRGKALIEAVSWMTLKEEEELLRR